MFTACIYSQETSDVLSKLKLLGNTVRQRKCPFWTVPVSENNICDEEEDFKAWSKAMIANVKISPLKKHRPEQKTWADRD